MKCGFYKHHSKGQRYLCKKCKRRFTIRMGFRFKKKTPNKVINYAVRLANQVDPAFSTRDISKEIGLKFGLDVSHVTVAKWLKQFA